MNLVIKKFYAAGDSGGPVEFDYAQVGSALDTMASLIKNIQNALSDKIEITSYQGEAQGNVEAAIDSIRTSLATMDKPLADMAAKIDEVKNTYKAREEGIKTALSGAASGKPTSTGPANTTNYIN